MNDSKPQKSKNTQKTKKVPRKITERYLRNSGLFYLQRFTASSGHFKTVMGRKIKKSCYHHKDQNYEDCISILDKITNEFLEQGILDDNGYLRGMVTSLRRSGKSRKEIIAKLTQKQLKPNDINNALDLYDTENNEDPTEAEFFAALKFARKKRLGPYDTIHKYEHEKALNTFARKGFNYDTIRRVMELSENDIYELGYNAP